MLLDTNHPLLEDTLTNAGFECEYLPDLDREGLKAVIGIYTGVIVRSRFRLDREILEQAGRLKFIGRVGAGMEGIDLAYAASRGIRCLNAPEGNRNAVGEHALGMLLALMNKLIIVDKEVRQGTWLREENRGNELEGKTVAIIGYGNTGGAFARKLSGFDCRVIAYDKYKKGYSDQFVEETNMDEVFREADVLSLHVPLTEETTYLVNGTCLEKFSKKIWLINTSRGKVLDTSHLLQAIDKGTVRGAALDVLEYENHSFESLDEKDLPQPYRKLIASDKVILSPHIAGWTHESKVKLAKVIVEKILEEF